jgi:O-antigen/teichoic acid export membrane protein
MSDTGDVSGGSLVRNTLANGVAKVVVAVLAIALTPIFLRDLGVAEYGVWLLAVTLTFGSGYVGLADLGLQQAGVRFVAEARSRGDNRAVSEVASTTVVFFAVLGIVVAALLAVLVGPLVRLFDVEPGLIHAARVTFLLVGLQIAIDLPAAGLLAVVEGSQRYGSLRLIEIGGRVVWGVVAFAAVVLGHGIVALAVISLAVAIVSAFASWAAARRAQPELTIRLALATKATLVGMLRYSSSLLALRTLSVLYRQMDKAIIGIVLVAAAVAEYEVAYKIHAAAALVLSIAPSAVMPAAAYVGAAGDRKRLRALYVRGTKYALAMSLPVTIAGLLYTRPLIATWVGSGYEHLTGVTRLFLIYPAIVVVHTIGVTMLFGLGRMKGLLRLNLLAVGVNLAVSLALVRPLGIAGVVWGTLAGYVVVWLPYLRLFLREFDVRLRAWFSEVIWPNLPGAAVQLALGIATLGFADRLGQLWQVLALFSLSCVASIATFLALLPPAERSRLVAAVTRRSPAPPVAVAAP